MPRSLPFTGKTLGKLKITISRKDLDFIEYDVPEAIARGANKGIREYLYFLKDFVTDEHGAWNRAWKHDTTTLQHGHEVFRTRGESMGIGTRGGKFGFGWSLVADPYLNPQQGKIVTEDYGWILEYGGHEWLWPGYEATEDKLEEFVRNNIKGEL